MIKLGDTVSGFKTDAELGFEILQADTLQPSMPLTRDKVMQIGGRHGLWDFGADMQPLVFQFHCHFTSVSTDAQVQAAYRTLSAYLLDGNGNPKTHEMIIDSEPDKFYYVRFAGDMTVDPGQFKRRKFVLPLIAHDPVAYGSLVENDTNATTSPKVITYTVVSGLNVYPVITLDNDGVNTINGFTFVTLEDIFDYTGGA